MKAKLKIEETRAGYRCRVCGRRFRTEEAAFVHQSYNCSRDGRTLIWGLVSTSIKMYWS